MGREKEHQTKRVTQLILVRHGETEWSREKRYQGRQDTDLTAEGRRDMQLVATRLHDEKIDRIYTSSLKRAKESAEIIGRKIKKKPHADPRLNELWFGRWEGKTAKELIKAGDPLFRRWCSGRIVSPPAGESLNSLRKRVAQFLSETVKKHCGVKILVVSHGGFIRMLLFEALKLKRGSFWSVRIDTGSISVLNFYRDFAQVAKLNDCCHLTRKTG